MVCYFPFLSTIPPTFLRFFSCRPSRSISLGSPPTVNPGNRKKLGKSISYFSQSPQPMPDWFQHFSTWYGFNDLFNFNVNQHIFLVTVLKYPVNIVILLRQELSIQYDIETPSKGTTFVQESDLRWHKTRFSALFFKREPNDTLCFMCLHFKRKGKVPGLTHVSKILKDDFEYLTV